MRKRKQRGEGVAEESRGEEALQEEHKIGLQRGRGGSKRRSRGERVEEE